MITLAVTLFGIAVFQLFPNQLLGLFNAQNEILAIGQVALRIVCFAFPFMGITLLFGAFFQALGHSKITMFTSIIELVLMLTIAIVLRMVGTVYTVWFCFILTEAIVAAFAILFMQKVNRETIQAM